MRGGDGTKAKQPTKTGFAHLLGDGGTIKCRQVNKTYPFVSGMDLAEVGDGGLTLDDNGFSCRVVQGFVDAPGASGTLTKTGNGTISLVSPGEYSVSTTRVARGTLLVQTNGTSTAVSMDTAIVVVDGAMLSTVGDAETLNLASLKVSDSTLALDPGDSIVVSGDAEFSGLTLNFSSLPSVGELRDFLVVNGTISAASANAVKSAVFANGFAEGTYGSVTVSQSGGATVFTFSVKEAAVISGETAWRGPGSAWSDGANWSDGAPGESDEAVVGDVSAPSPVVVSGAQDVGAVTFAGGPYEISGSGSLALSSPGASFVRSNIGTNIVSVPVSAVGDMPVAVAADSSLELAGTLSSAGLTKTGGGRLVLSGANALSGTVSFGAGMNVVSNTSALSGATVVSVADATLRFAEGSGGTYPSTETFTLASSNAAGAVVFDCNDDVTLTSFIPASGALVKRGAGTLTLDASTGHITTLSTTSGDGQNGGGVVDGSRKVFAEDGTPPSGGYGALTVAEGELVVRGSGAETLSTVGKFIVGMNVAECRAQPVLTFDNVTVSEPSLNQFQQHEVGYKCATGGITNPVLRVLNGATLNTRGLMMDFQYSAVARWPVIAITNSTVTASADGIQFSTVRQSTGHGRLLASNSTLRANAFAVNGRTFSRLTACDIRGYSGDYTTLSADRNVAGEVLFDGGTTLRCNAFAMTDYDSRYGSDLTLAFDGATWDVGPDDLTINDSNMLQTRPKTFDVRAGGLTLVVASGRTLRTSVPFAGIGTLSLTGGGTLAFETGAFAITGGVHAASGTVVDFSSVGSVSNFTASGSGTFSGATFSRGLTIAPEIGDGWTVGATPLFDGCSFAGRVVVDCGHSTGTPLPTCQTPVVVARYTGPAPDVSSWRVSGTGMPRVGGSFTAADGQISMTVASKGLAIIYR